MQLHPSIFEKVSIAPINLEQRGHFWSVLWDRKNLHPSIWNPNHGPVEHILRYLLDIKEVLIPKVQLQDLTVKDNFTIDQEHLLFEF